MKDVYSKLELCQYCFNQREFYQINESGSMEMLACPRCTFYNIVPKKNDYSTRIKAIKEMQNSLLNQGIKI